MNKESRAYLKAKELDKLGFAERIIEASRLSEEEDPGPNSSAMGSLLNTMTSKTAKGLNWMKPSTHVEEESDWEEYEVKQEPVIEEPKDEPDLYKEEIEALDPMLVRGTREFQESVSKLENILFSNRKLPSFNLQIQPEQEEQFTAFINWINQTSGGVYKTTKILDTTIVTKYPSQAATEFESASCSRNVSPHVGYDHPSTVAESVASGSETGTSESYTHAGDYGKDQMTSSGQALLIQLQKGILLPPKNKRDKKKLVTLKGLKMSESDITRILVSQPIMTMPDLIKKLYKKKKTWALLNSLYLVDDYQVRD